jgi:GT2 family glycosyltransferase
VVSHDPNIVTDWKITTIRSEKNTGFIEPNNELAAWGDSEYIVLLNSDTKVFPNWDRLMTGFMEANDVAEVGYWGGHMGPDGRGFGGANGHDVDYIPGWCLCIARQTYDQFGLFNKQLKFAYCEDADLSLRLKEAGKKIYSLHAPLVHHYQNKTIVDVEKEGEVDVRASFEHNHQYIKERWHDYIANERVLLKRKGIQDEQF